MKCDLIVNKFQRNEDQNVINTGDYNSRPRNNQVKT